jgi:hypothetical protein
LQGHAKVVSGDVMGAKKSDLPLVIDDLLLVIFEEWLSSTNRE